jgi:hypothetical protein
MTNNNNQSSSGQAPKAKRDPAPEKIAKTRMPGKVEQRQQGEKENSR